MGGWRVAAAIVLVLLASGCTGPASSAPSPSTPSPSPSATAVPSASASPSPTSNRDRAEASARATVDYYRVLDTVTSDPDVSMSQLEAALAGDYLAAWRADLEKSRTDGWSQSGSTELIDVITQGVEARSGGDWRPAPRGIGASA